jgi:hypothetical protein
MLVFQIILAGFSMLIKDSLEAVIAQSEARNHDILAGVFDVIKWPCEIFTQGTAIFILFENYPIWLKLLVVISIEIGNFAGRFLGTYFGSRFIKEEIYVTRH